MFVETNEFTLRVGEATLRFEQTENETVVYIRPHRKKTWLPGISIERIIECQDLLTSSVSPEYLGKLVEVVRGN